MNAINSGAGTNPAGIGQPIDRVDGALKVGGHAPYSADVTLPNMLHAVLVQSTIVAGTITGLDVAAASRMPGVVLIITPDNALKLTPSKAVQQTITRPLLQDRKVFYNGQAVAIVIADTLDRAEAAAAHVRVTYQGAPHVTPVMPAHPATGGAAGSHPPKDFSNGREPANTTRGTPEAALRTAPVKLHEQYATPIEHHNPMEPHATLAVWNNDRLTVWHTTQGIAGTRETLATMFDIAPEHVQVNCPYVGGGFGSKGNTWPPATLAAMAAKQTGRAVKLVLSRRDMFTANGYRPRTLQRVQLGAAPDGTLLAIQHESVSQMSDAALGEFAESCAVATRMMYRCANVKTSHRLVRVDASLPTYMRAPGESTGMFALESAMDEMAARLTMDPLAFRLKNYAEEDGQQQKPFSAKHLRECYETGAAMFGWSRRTAAPRSMRNGRMLVGYGMATATYPANRLPASAKVRLNADGSVVVGCATQDLGTGTYTIMTQIAADAFGVPANQVTALLGDSRLPKAPVSGGSFTIASISPAIQQACAMVRRQAVSLAPGGGDDTEAYRIENGAVITPHATHRLEDLLGRAGKPYLEATAQSDMGDGRSAHSLHSFGAQFAEVHVDPDLGEIRVARYVGVFDGGRILNPKTGRSQLLGGIVYGIGMALTEETETDPNTGRIVNANLAEYMVPVNPDTPKIEVAFVGAPDPAINPLGARGIGELPMVGVAPAIANAVYHATGRRIRSLPIRLEHVLA